MISSTTSGAVVNRRSQLHELWELLEQRGATVWWLDFESLSLSTVGALIEEAEYRLRVLTEVHS